MSASFGKNLKVTIFGESHSTGIGIVIDGLGAGIELDFNYIDKEMKRRAPGRSKLSTSRKETDTVEIISGFFDGFTTGTPICAIIKNNNTRSKDYTKIKDIMRPGHADYTGHIKYKGYNDYRGGGHFSGRLTAPLVFAGSIAKQILERDYNVHIASHIKSVYNVEDCLYTEKTLNEETMKNLSNEHLPLLNKEKKDEIEKVILEAKEKGDSVGGIIETAIINLKAGIGDPFFESIESKLASMMFSIPAIKGIEFGAGFKLPYMLGSQANDEFAMNGRNVTTVTNNNGGVLGGITNSMPVIFKVAVKPTPSIKVSQNTINIKEKINTELSIEGRHDPCIIPRVLPVVDCASALVILDSIMEGK